MPPIAQRLREPAAFVLLAFGAISTLFHLITFLFGPGQGDGGISPSFSDRAVTAGGTLLNPVVIGALAGAVMLAHVQSHLKTAKVLSLVALITVGVAGLFGLVALFAAFGANGYPGWDKAQDFFINLAELAVTGVAAWLILGYFQQHGPARPAPGFGQQPPAQQWGQPQPPQQWQPPQTQAPAPGAWGPPPAQQVPGPPPQQWGQPQPPVPGQGGGAGPDAMMTQAIPTVAPGGPQGGQGPQDGGGSLPVGNWTSE